MPVPLSVNLVFLKHRIYHQAEDDFYQPPLTDFNDFFPAIWAAFKEVKAFYNLDEERLKIGCFFAAESQEPELSTILGSGSASGSGWGRLLKSFTNAQTNQRLINEEEFIPISRSSLDAFARVETSDTYDGDRVAIWTKEMLRQKRFEGTPVVVFDQELTPPPQWRYVIWADRVVSVVPTDPTYWGMKDDNKIVTIKHRVRTACLSIIGQLLKLKRCSNDRCFLFGNVDSVLRLDKMVELGPEHNIKMLSGKGFDICPPDPAKVQPIREHPVQVR